MSAIQLQSDISSLSIQGFGAFQTVLTALSADNVAPMAVIQMQKFGSLFNVNGKFAEQAPDLMKRFSTSPVGRLAVAVGWRKGDTASLLAESAGGQAAALLSVALRSLFSRDHCGEVLFHCSANVLPAQSAISSILQLANVADVLATKMAPTGFGTYLSEQVSRVLDAYQTLGIQKPGDLLDDLTVESASDLLTSLSRALREEDEVLRVGGTSGMGHILGLVLFLFPQNVTVTIDGVVIREGPIQNIILEFKVSPRGPTTIMLEHKVLTDAPLASYKIKCQPHQRLTAQYRLKWHGWVAHCMQLVFTKAGLICTEKDLHDFANFAIAFLYEEGPPGTALHPSGVPCYQLSGLMSPDPWRSVVSICEEILLMTPAKQLPLRDAFNNLTASLQQKVDNEGICSCRDDKCDFRSGWSVGPFDYNNFCKAFILWNKIANLLCMTLCSFLVSAGPDATISDPLSLHLYGNRVKSMVARILSLERGYVGNESPLDNNDLYRAVFSLLMSSSRSNNDLVTSDGSTLYPQVLETLSVGCDQLASFKLVDGMVLYRDRYHSCVYSGPGRWRLTAKKHILDSGVGTVPSSLGEHSQLFMTVRETATGLELTTSIRCYGIDTRLELCSILTGYMMMRRTTSCPHTPNRPLTLSQPPVLATTVATPLGTADERSGCISVVMTKDNPTAQVLSCEPRVKILLLENCCLDCAVLEAEKNSCRMIIVG